MHIGAENPTICRSISDEYLDQVNFKDKTRRTHYQFLNHLHNYLPTVRLRD